MRLEQIHISNAPDHISQELSDFDVHLATVNSHRIIIKTCISRQIYWSELPPFFVKINTTKRKVILTFTYFFQHKDKTLSLCSIALSYDLLLSKMQKYLKWHCNSRNNVFNVTYMKFLKSRFNNTESVTTNHLPFCSHCFIRFCLDRFFSPMQQFHSTLLL
jgi:hypothetical protein